MKAILREALVLSVCGIGFWIGYTACHADQTCKYTEENIRMNMEMSESIQKKHSK